MNVGTICQRRLFTVRPADEIVHAARLMREKHVGYLVVVEPDAAGLLRAVGVLTDRDIVVSVVARDVHPRTLCVGDIMTSNPITVRNTDSIEESLRKLGRAGVRRAPVVDQVDQLMGVLSLDDLVKVIAADTQDVVAAIRNERHTEGATPLGRRANGRRNYS